MNLQDEVQRLERKEQTLLLLRTNSEEVRLLVKAFNSITQYLDFHSVCVEDALTMKPGVVQT